MADGRILTAVPIALADGTVTVADVTIAAAERPQPTILVRTPYGRRTGFHQYPVTSARALERGYNLVLQDVRGRGDSLGSFVPFRQEVVDGRDTLDWIVAQPWSDGAVVMIGPSYVGATQWLAAASGHPALRAIAPLNSTPWFGETWSFRNGVREHEFLACWLAAALAPESERLLDELDRVCDDPSSIAATVPDAASWFTRNVDDPYWGEISVDPLAIDVPVFTITGWYDIFTAGAIEAARRRDRADDRLVIGPWGHDNLLGHLQGEANLGIAGSGDAIAVGEQILDFFDAAVGREAPVGPRVSAFELGTRRWRSGEELEGADREVSIAFGDARFTVDLDALPDLPGGHGLRVGGVHSGWGPRDLAGFAAHPGVAVLKAEPLDRELVVVGSPRIEATSPAVEPGAQWVAALGCEREGRIDLITETVGWAQGERVDLRFAPWLHTLEAGMRLVLIIAGGAAPRWERPRAGGGDRRLTDVRLRSRVVDSPTAGI